jgi:hypothetical protein
MEEKASEAVALGIVLFWFLVFVVWGGWATWQYHKKKNKTHTTYEDPIEYIRADCDCPQCRAWRWDSTDEQKAPASDG